MHPLDPLAPSDVEATMQVLRDSGLVTADRRVARLEVLEPAKEALRAFEAGGLPPERLTRTALFDLSSGVLGEAVVSVDGQRLTSWTERPGRAPGLLAEERAAMEQLIKADTRWQDAVRRRGVEDPDQVHFEFMAAPDLITEPGQRRVRAVGFLQRHARDNYYAHPIDRLVVLCDVTANRIMDVEEDDPAPPVPKQSGDFSPEDIGPARADLRPLEIIQPEGPSFVLDGHLLRWQKWEMRVGFHPVEGLVLHRVGYRDGERLRPLLYRAALSEMIVPYADPSISQWWRAVFDAGEVGLGAHTDSLELGCDCLGEIRYLDVTVAGPDGAARTIRNAICIHEEDYGLAWKHDGMFVATTESRRLRRLVVSFFATVGNYDYGFYWYFYPDGSLEAEVKLTGIIYTGAVVDGVEPEHGGLVAPNLYGPNHQHLFCFRLDTEVDGERNSVEEVNVDPMPPGPENPWGNAFAVSTTRFGSESEAQRHSDPARSRYWKIVNDHSRNRLGRPVAYKLVPQYSPTLVADPSAHVSNVAAFASRHLWVTPFQAGETHAGGDYPAFGDVGLAEWASADRPIDDRDIVVWHVVGSTHIVRPEDWPVMPVERVGFALKPVGFFDRNPALDLPPSDPHCASDAHAGHAQHAEHGPHDDPSAVQQEMPGRWSPREGH
ncbi:MAG TPA: primary-amine oxidase [Candidatus Limnocylindrales bacterium]|nr:primary-amine oxidase [Candidatus Limnocylindrales bacterium]